MPEIPDAAVTAAVNALRASTWTGPDLTNLGDSDVRAIARTALHAAAPLIAEPLRAERDQARAEVEHLRGARDQARDQAYAEIAATLAARMAKIEVMAADLRADADGVHIAFDLPVEEIGKARTVVNAMVEQLTSGPGSGPANARAED